MDNIFTERLWRTVKYEDVYLKAYATIAEARAGLTHYFRFYNEERPHQSLDYQTPASIYFAGDLPKQKRAVALGTLSTLTV
jgi:putative transposase